MFSASGKFILEINTHGKPHLLSLRPPNPAPSRNVPCRRLLRRRSRPAALRQQIQHRPPAGEGEDEFRGYHKTDGTLQNAGHIPHEAIQV